MAVVADIHENTSPNHTRNGQAAMARPAIHLFLVFTPSRGERLREDGRREDGRDVDSARYVPPSGGHRSRPASAKQLRCRQRLTSSGELCLSDGWRAVGRLRAVESVTVLRIWGMRFAWRNQIRKRRCLWCGGAGGAWGCRRGNGGADLGADRLRDTEKIGHGVMPP